MTNHDLSRRLHSTGNRYTGVRMQQSRALLDSDLGEAEALDDADAQELLVDVIGPHGSADDGFKIGAVFKDKYDFEILSGSYYLGGIRHRIEGLDGSSFPQRFRTQSDWAQSTREDIVADFPTVPAGTRSDLVLLLGWEQAVTALEDREFHELALGGPDTAVRMRAMHRVLVSRDCPPDCTEAFAGVVAELEDDGHSFDWSNHELRSGASLTVVLDTELEGDLCTPGIPAGYAGTENQAIRIQLIAPDKLLWSFDNAAPLYRVAATPGGSQATLTFLTPPRDQAHFPRVGQVIELLPWGAKLANGEYVAEHAISENVGGGLFVRVVQSYSAAASTVTVRVDDPSALLELLSWFEVQQIDPSMRSLYARVWNPGDAGSEAAMGVQFTPNTAVPLAGTGLKVKLSQPGMIGDHWIVAARPSTPREPVPWQLLAGEAPHGPRRFICPLAVIHWTSNPANGSLSYEVDSCRRMFKPLTRQNGCCTVTVGDGETSFGDYTSISAAIRALPAEQPATICVLPGLYEERVIIDKRQGLTIRGCGARTVVRTPSGNLTCEALIAITESSNIRLQDFHVEAIGQFGITVFGGLGSWEGLALSRDVRLERLDVTTRKDDAAEAVDFNKLWLPEGSAPFPLGTVAALLVERLLISECKLTMVGDLSAAPNVCLSTFCGQTVIRACQILTPPGEASYSKAWGGIHLGSGVSDARIEDCVIAGGLGPGITLGLASVEDSFESLFDYLDPCGRFVLVGGATNPGSTAAIVATAPPRGGGDPAAVQLSGSMRGIRISGNAIKDMGSSGISILGFWPNPGPYYELVEVHDLVIADNTISNNFSRPPVSMPVGYDEVVAFGGIVLGSSEGLKIHDNVIQNNGSPTVWPSCGIYVCHGENITVENNTVTDNGKRPTAGTLLTGIRAGIALQHVGRRSISTSATDTFLPAARVRGNTVQQPVGRALQVYGIGPMFIEGNTLASQGLGPGATEDAVHCVAVHNIGMSSDLIDHGTVPAFEGIFPAPPLLLDDPLEVDEYFLDGRVLFTDNQVRFNPVEGEADDIYAAAQFQSYGDVAVQDNQFYVRFPAGGGTMVNDTTVAAWSTRTSNNRWEDPPAGDPPEISAWTLAVMNITAYNQATRCIHVEVTPSPPTIVDNPVDYNQTFADCDGGEEFELLLLPPP